MVSIHGILLLLAMYIASFVMMTSSSEALLHDDITTKIKRSASGEAMSSAEADPANGGQSRNRARARTRPRVHGQSRVEEDLPYYWMCPEVRCPVIPASCETVEYFEVEHRYEVRSKIINVRCRSCQYCLDGPATFINGNRRAVSELADEPAAVNKCPLLQCPSLPDDCNDVKLTNLLVHGQLCRQCPACYDHTIVNIMAQL